MMTDNYWIRTVDHRISTALILFLLLLLSNGKKRQMFPLRAVTSLVMMCITSWLIRCVIDIALFSVVQKGMGYSFHLLVMSLVFCGSYSLCYESSAWGISYAGLLGLTIYKLAWNTFKACASAAQLFGAAALWSTYSVMGSLVSYLVYISVCLIACALHRNVIKAAPPDSSVKSMMVAFFVFLLGQCVLEFCGHVFSADSSALFLFYFCTLMYTMINYALLLTFAQMVRYQRDNEDMHNFIQNKMQYYRMSREGITSLQIKCHDLKHQIAAIRSQTDKASFDKYISKLEDSIIEYGTVVECGNETINIVLTEKNILCSTCGVKFSYILDGAIFNFMSEREIYSLFGNALDNALESCSKVTDPEKRVISLKANMRGDMVVLRVENFFEESPTLVDGMPVTTKKGSGHGFGLRSIQQIADQYNGVASVQVEDPIFRLTVMLRPGNSE